MLETLANLPKLIDAFVVGAIEFVYRYLSAIALVVAHPTSGPTRLRADEDRLSSRTVLFCSCTLLSMADFVGVEQLASLAAENSWPALLIRIVVFYIMFDLLAATASLAALSEERGNARSLMRYSFGASLALLAALALLLQFVALILGKDSNWPISHGNAQTSSQGVLAALVILAFLPPFVTFIGLSRRSGVGRLSKPVSFSAAVVGELFALAAVALGPPASELLKVITGGRIQTSSETCDLGLDAFHVTAAIRNGRSETLALSRKSLLLEIAPDNPRDKEDIDAMLKHVAFRLDFDKLDGGILVLKPGEVGIFKGDAKFGDGTEKIMKAQHYKLVCRLAGRNLPDWLLRSTGRFVTVTNDESSDDFTPASRDVPIYVPSNPPLSQSDDDPASGQPSPDNPRASRVPEYRPTKPEAAGSEGSRPAPSKARQPGPRP